MSEEKEPMASSIAELSKKESKRLAESLKRGKWGAWYITKDRKYFGINRLYRYEFAMSDLKADGPLHWLAHLREKTWLERGDIEDLIKSFDDLFGYFWIYDEMKSLRSKKVR